MSAPGRPKREYRSAQHEGNPMKSAGPSQNSNCALPADRAVRTRGSAAATRLRKTTLLLVLAALIVAGCATQPPSPAGQAASTLPPAGSVLRSTVIDRGLEDRILALDPEHLTEADVRGTLAAGPAPRIVLLHGGVPMVYLLMKSFGRFLVGMGYPEARIRDPLNQDWSRSPYEDSAHVAGLVAWYYERDGLRPMVVGHSQGGVQAVKVLRTLNGSFGDRIAVWDPLADAALDRTIILDPLTGREQPVVGFTLPYASVVGAGGISLANPRHWDMIGHLYSVPNTVEDFTGYSIEFDPIAWTGDAPAQYKHNGTANVRNVMLPASYSHVFVPFTHELASDARTRDWINAYTPLAGEAPNPPPDIGQNALWAADVWFSVKKHWCLEVQRLIRARRAALGTP
jgi:hypothetical protein